MNGYHSRTSPSSNSDGFGGFTSNQQPTSNSKGKQRDDGNYNSNYNYNLQSQQNYNYDSANHYPQQSYSNSNQEINHQSQPRQQAFENGAPAHSQSVSPLDTLKQRSKQVTASSASPSSSNPNTNYQAAFALSRRTSLRSRTTGPGASSRRRGIGEQSLEEEEDLRHALDDGDDVRSLRSINLLAQDEDSVTPSRRNGEGYSNGNNSNGKSPRTGYEEDDTIGPQRFQDSNSPNLSNSNYRNNRESSNLLGGAFRDSIASDISFNSITGNSERNSMAPNHLLSNSSTSKQSNLYDSSTSLQRRESIDTVRSSEFGENGRWGKAWASNSDDEDSLWDGGSQMDASEWDNGSNADRRSLMERDLDLEGDEVNGLTNSMKRNTITSNPTPASLYKNEMRQQNQQRELQQQSNQHQVQVTSSNNNSPQLHPGLSRQHVVSLTPSISNSSNARWSSSSQMESSNPIAYPSSPNPRPKDRDSVSTIRGMSASSRDSVSTLRSGENGLDFNSNDPARVYVWPPSPAGSTASSIRSRNGDRLGSGLNPGYAPSSSSSSAGGAYSGMRVVEPQRAEIETASLYGSEASWDSQAEDERDQGGDYDLNSTAHSDLTEESSGSNSSGEFYDASEHRSRPTGPVGPSTILAQPLNTPLVGPGARRGNFSDGRRDSSGSIRSGHPTGRAPPPAPGGYSDPNQVMGMNPIGKTRAKAIADADGRESMISDLDVETLRLEMSSRRDSTSTVGSRMSVGTVKWGEEEQEDQLRELNSDFNERNSLESRYGNNQNGEVEGTPKVGSISNRGLQQPAQFSGINSANTYGNNQPSNPHPFPATQRKTSLDTNTSSASSIMTSNSSSFLTSSAALSIPTNKPTPTPQPTDTRTGPTQAEELLSQGIAYHEQGDLSRSAYYLERSARTQGGCVVGMCMWGMALREGWGVRKDPKRGAEWIQRAARKAGEMMGNESNTPKSEQELKAIRSELKLSVYELGKCYCYGWGVKMDKKMSLEYFELAGKLGDPDAAAEAGALWAAGKGCKKDLKKAAAFYRMAIEAGYDGVGLSWVYKPKWL